jgi:hypothetical protein
MKVSVNKRDTLIKKIRSQGLPSFSDPLPVVSLEDFFEGNEDYGSIGCNLLEHPSPQRFFEHLLAIRSRSDVQDVLIEIFEVEESDSTIWPFSERVYVLTSASTEDVADWMKPLEPDEIEVGYFQDKPPAAPELREGMRVYAAWWD